MTENICTIEVKDKKLRIMYNKQQYGLHTIFSSDERIKEYILNHLEDAFFDAVRLEEDGTYYLNIASAADFGAFEWEKNEVLLKQQLDIFTPIIQLFVIYAMTKRL